MKGIALTTAVFLPISCVLFLILFAGRSVLYPWVRTPVPVKAAWLNVPFMSLRIGLGVALLYWVALRFSRAVFDEQPGAADSAEARNRRNRLATALLVLFVVVLSLWGFDLVMSLDPKWYSGLLGGYYVVSTLYTGFGLVAFLTIRANARGLTSVSPSAIQDVTKLTFAMCVMWMYFFFSQYLVIWYGNVPVETKFFLRRFFNDPWRTMAFVIFIVGWLVPFGYLLKRLTGRPPTAHKPLVVILFMGWAAIFLERILLVFPALAPVPLAIRTTDEGGEHLEQLVLLGEQPADARPIGPRAAWIRSPTVSRDGRTVVLELGRDAVRNLHRLDVATGAVQPLTDDPEGNFEPSLSPDGRRIAFTAFTSTITVAITSRRFGPR